MIAKVVNTDVLIKKQNCDQDVKLMKATICDSAGMMGILLKDDWINKTKLGDNFIFRSLKVQILDGYVYLLCDENSQVFPFKESIKLNMANLRTTKNFSKVKTVKYDKNLLD